MRYPIKDSPPMRPAGHSVSPLKAWADSGGRAPLPRYKEPKMKQLKIDLDETNRATIDKVILFYKTQGVRLSQASVIRHALHQLAKSLSQHQPEA